MPRKRKTPKLRSLVTPEAIQHFRNGDYHKLHRALKLKPWQTSPLPIERCELGVSFDPPQRWDDPHDWKVAQELRRELEAGNAA